MGRRNDAPVVYGEEQQAICTAQIMTPVFGVFAPAIRHVLIVCTTTEASSQGVYTALQIHMR